MNNVICVDFNKRRVLLPRLMVSRNTGAITQKGYVYEGIENARAAIKRLELLFDQLRDTAAVHDKSNVTDED